MRWLRLTNPIRIRLTVAFLLACVAFASPSYSANSDILTNLGLGSRQAKLFLSADEAFAFSAEQQDNTVQVQLTIAPDYYLYRHSIEVLTDKESSHILRFQAPKLPKGQAHHDEFFGNSQVFYHSLSFPVVLQAVSPNAELLIRYQGCTQGLCYPPVEKRIRLTKIAASAQPFAVTLSEQDQLANQLAHKSSWLNIAVFFALGLGLAFTPCVFPMYPILTGIIAGAGTKLSTRRAFVLSFSYVQGMAITYTLLGLVVASAGLQFQAALQHPYILISLALLFVLLAASMFGAFTLQLPSALQTQLNQLSQRRQGGSVTGVALMGVISGLVCSPCTTAPLSGALLYVAQSGDRWLGSVALYSLSIGMGLPLLLLGSSGGKLLPKAGVWMVVVKQLFGFALLAVPIMLLTRLLSAQNSALLWLGWGLLLCAYLHHLLAKQAHSAVRSVASFALLVTIISLVVLGKDQLMPAQAAIVKPHSQVSFTRIKTIAEFEAALSQAKGKAVLLDLYADWCVACKEFEQKTFSEPQVQTQLSNMVLLQADVTANDRQDIALLNHLQVLGLPTLLLFDKQGAPLPQLTITGFMPPPTFLARLAQLP